MTLKNLILKSFKKGDTMENVARRLSTNVKYKRYAQQSKYLDVRSFVLYVLCMMNDTVKDIAMLAISYGGVNYFKKQIWKLFFELKPMGGFDGIETEDMEQMNWEEIVKRIRLTY